MVNEENRSRLCFSIAARGHWEVLIKNHRMPLLSGEYFGIICVHASCFKPFSISFRAGIKGRKLIVIFLVVVETIPVLLQNSSCDFESVNTGEDP